MNVCGSLHRVFTSIFGTDLDYFQKERGRAGFYPTQLSKRHGISKKQAIQLSAAFNRWLSLLEDVTLPSKALLIMQTCTWKYSARRNPLNYHCRKKICPWCQGLKVLRIQKLLDRLKPDRMLFRSGGFEDKKSVYRQPHLRKGLVLLTVRNILMDFFSGDSDYACHALFFVRGSSTGRCYTDTLAKDTVQRILMPSLHTLQSDKLPQYMTLARAQKNITQCRQT